MNIVSRMDAEEQVEKNRKRVKEKERIDQKNCLEE